VLNALLSVCMPSPTPPVPPPRLQPLEGDPVIERFAKLAAELSVVLPSESGWLQLL
jgi:hypothetical protein